MSIDTFEVVKLVDLVGLHLEATSGAPIVLLREHDAPHRVLPIFVGGPEAASIASALSGQLPPRPLTHDVMAALVETVGAQIDAVEVTDLHDGAFSAVLAVSGPDGGRRLDTRPSDGIALAVRLGTPLFVSEAVLDEAGTVLAEAPDEEAIDAAVAEFRSVLDDIDASDFGAPAIGELPAIASAGSDEVEDRSDDDSDAITELPARSSDDNNEDDSEDDDESEADGENTSTGR